MDPGRTRAAAVAIASCLALASPAAADPVQRIIDGDTIVLVGGERIRIENIDAPEVGHAQCTSEREWGLRATNHLRLILARGEPALTRIGHDRFGRTLARLTINGRDVGEEMVAARMAVVFGRGRPSWCAMAAPH